MPFIDELFRLIARLAWPGVAAFFAWRFRAAISEAIPLLAGRVTRVGPTGVDFANVNEQRDAPPENLTQDAAVKPQADRGPLPPALAGLEEALRISANKIPDTTDKIETLIRNLAATRLDLGHERVYRNIFGSQIRALIVLRSRKVASEVEARNFFQTETALVRAQYSGYGFDGWIQFLINNSLIQRIDGGFKITLFGEDFVGYLDRTQIPTNKPL